MAAVALGPRSAGRGGVVIVCHCRSVSDRVVHAEVRSGATTVDDVTARCGAGSDCGGCLRRLQQLVDVVATVALVPARAGATTVAA